MEKGIANLMGIGYRVRSKPRTKRDSNPIHWKATGWDWVGIQRACTLIIPWSLFTSLLPKAMRAVQILAPSPAVRPYVLASHAVMQASVLPPLLVLGGLAWQ